MGFPIRDLSSASTPREARSPAESDGPRGSLRRAAARWLREPLLHFLLLGAALFAISRVLNPSAGKPTPSRQIVLTLDDVRQLQIGFAARWERSPSRQEMLSLIENRIREEVLYREGLALGLDKDDTIVKRRMAQKMEFLAQDVSDAREPTSDELRTWFAKHPEQFAQPGRVTFSHLYFSPDTRGPHAHDDATEALAKLAGMPEDSPDTKTLGDPFMFQSYLADRSPEQLAKDFGPRFARSLFDLAPGSWQGPIESGYGWHLVFVESSTPGRVPAFEEVEPDAKTAWKADQHAKGWRKAYEAMRAKYEFVLPASPATDTHDGNAPAAKVPP
jgi:peptidyl-prolyl cis-trans isomerase C